MSSELLRDSVRADVALLEKALKAEDDKRSTTTWGFDKKTLQLSISAAFVAKLNGLKYECYVSHIVVAGLSQLRACAVSLAIVHDICALLP